MLHMQRVKMWVAAVVVALISVGCMPEEISDSEIEKSIAAAQAPADVVGGDISIDVSRSGAETSGSDAGDVSQNDNDSGSDTITQDAVEADVDATITPEVDAATKDGEIASTTDAEVAEEVADADVTGSPEIDALDDAADVEYTDDTVDAAEEVSVASDSDDGSNDTSDADDTQDEVDSDDGSSSDVADEIETDTGLDVMMEDGDVEGTDVLTVDIAIDVSEVEIVDAADAADAQDTAEVVVAVDTTPDTQPDTGPDAQSDIFPDLPPVDMCAGGKSCDDGNSCTLDSCDKEAGCVNASQSGVCDDGNVCTVGDACNGGACVAGGAKSCDDGNACTNDFCHPIQGCVFKSKTITYGYDTTPPLPPEWTKSAQMHVGCDNSNTTSTFKYLCVLKVKEGTPAWSKEFAQLDLTQVRQLNNYGAENLAVAFKMARFQSSKNQDIMSWSAKDASGKVLQSGALDETGSKLFEIVAGPNATTLVFSEELTTLPLNVGPALWGPVTITPVSCPLP